jgi:hypothetical protein
VTGRRAALLAGGVMLAVYVCTMAPSVTFWDAGEFIAAARVLGIPHPPGTPLFIVPLAAWAHLWFFLPFATATNLFSAVCTAAAIAIVALWIARATERPWMGVAAGILAGAMSSVWANATETEVYAASLFVSLAAVAAADLAGRGAASGSDRARNDDAGNERRWLVLAAYCLALAVPLHLSILVASPVVVYLAAAREDGTWNLPAGAALLSVSVAAAGVGRLSVPLVVVGALLLIASATVSLPSAPRVRGAVAAEIVVAFVVALCGLAILLLRARRDPAINQANPATLHQLAYVVGRRQYDVAPMWPRQAPIRIQLANWFEYADWQFALALGPTVIPTVARVVATTLFAVLGLVGASAHWALDRRSWRAVLLLFLCGTVGVIAYLNLKAGASFAWNSIPQDARHEARDRDYFFVLGFVAWGMWAGIGAVFAARRWKLPALAGVALAALPIALNWPAVSRRGEPEAGLPTEVARALLATLPPNAVLFVGGDNDTYPLWYAQQVLRLRNDVTVVTLPLIATPWYVDELDRRYGLAPGGWQPNPMMVAKQVARQAAIRGRPVAASLGVSAGDRNQIADKWTVVGSTAIESGKSSTGASGRVSLFPNLDVDTTATRAAAIQFERWRRGGSLRPELDPASDYFFDLLFCPRRILSTSPSRPPAVSLDSLCNLR